MTLDDHLAGGAWRVAITHPETPTGLCAPTILTPRSICDELEYLASCRGCGWTARHTDQCENDAVETAHEHSHPGYRDLPTLDLPSGWRQARTSKTVEAIRQLAVCHYPDGWIESGVAPNWTIRQPHGTRHVPDGGLFGGYDLARTIKPAGAAVALGTQGELFS